MKKLLSRRPLCILLIFAAVFGVYGIFLLITGGEYRMYVNYGGELEKYEVLFGEDADSTESSIYELKSAEEHSGYVKAVIKAVGRGEQQVMLRVYTSSGKNAGLAVLKTGPFGVIRNNLDRHIYFVLSALCLLAGAYCVYCFLVSTKQRRFSYDAVFFMSVALLLLLLVFVWCSALVFSFMRYHTTSSMLVYDLNRNLMSAITLFTMPAVLLYAVSVSVSNLALMVKEGFRPANALGIITSVVMACGIAVIAFLAYYTQNSPSVIAQVAYSVISSLFVFFETVLISTVFYGIYVSKHEPEYNKDYIIILGCKIRADGTLYPLLRGRADRAIEFYNAQKEKTGKQAVFIPSGGQGSDEIMPEGEAIKNYLISRGIPEEKIIAETNSATTKENMRFSKAIIDERSENAAAVFSTTSYHVFRSGAIAYSAGINIDGIGSKTKWYFWPNAFLRETAGIFLSQPKRQLLITVLISLAAGVGSYLYSLF